MQMRRKHIHCFSRKIYYPPSTAQKLRPVIPSSTARNGGAAISGMTRRVVMMNNVNTHSPTNRTLAVIDGGLNVEAGVHKLSTPPKPKLLEQVRQKDRAYRRRRSRKETAEAAGRADKGRSQESDRSHERPATFDGDSSIRWWFATDGMLPSPDQGYRFFSQRDRYPSG